MSLRTRRRFAGRARPTAGRRQQAFPCATPPPRAPARCARLAANLGGDTDTIGAMATGICGAFAGVGAIPAADLALLRSVNELSFDELAPQLATYR